MEGRELDARVAEVVFGRTVLRLDPISAEEGVFLVEEGSWMGGKAAPHWHGPIPTTEACPAYSSTWEGVGAVVAALAERQLSVRLSVLGSEGCTAEIGCWPHAVATGGDSLPEALARAALEALGKGER